MALLSNTLVEAEFHGGCPLGSHISEKQVQACLHRRFACDPTLAHHLYKLFAVVGHMHCFLLPMHEDFVPALTATCRRVYI